jgi:DnaJ homolog subfamily C member 3
LYYKRATAYFSLNRHSAALEDFEKVLSLTSHTFDSAFFMFMKAKIHAKDGHFSDACEALKRYTTKVKGDQAVTDLVFALVFALSELEAVTDKAERAEHAQLWAACSEFASKALRTASYSVQLRRLRADCALAAGDVEGAVGDLSYVSILMIPHYLTPFPQSRLTQLSSTASLMRIFRLAYFLLPRFAPGALSSPPLSSACTLIQTRSPASPPTAPSNHLANFLTLTEP